MLIAPASHPVLLSSFAAALLVIEAPVTCLMVSGTNQSGQIQQAEKFSAAISAYLYNDKPESDSPRRIVRGL